MLREDKVIEEIHRIRKKHYEETKDMPFEAMQARVHKNAEEFQKLLTEHENNKNVT
ncbi:MAG: hypothetical protein FWG55_00125 [Candidatus Bathyarchaeota archaeon]|nr:hypothetical protein [Candidatus Termiticorpusculum sp.]